MLRCVHATQSTYSNYCESDVLELSFVSHSVTHTQYNIIAVVAVIVPDLGDLISLIGAVASSALALIFPPLMEILVFVKPDNPIRFSLSWRVVEHAAWIIKDILIMLLGVVGLMFGTYASIDGIVNFKQEDTSECINFFPH